MGDEGSSFWLGCVASEPLAALRGFSAEASACGPCLVSPLVLVSQGFAVSSPSCAKNPWRVLLLISNPSASVLTEGS